MSDQIVDADKNTAPLPVTATSSAGLGARSKKYMIFTIYEERFAVPLSQVKEVIGLSRITPVPNVPKYFKGLINLRGKIISTIDLREKLKIPSKGESKKPCIIISEIKEIMIGTIVDDVAEVLGIDEAQITRQLDIVNPETREYCVGAARFQDKPLTLILDLEKALNIEDLAVLRPHAKAA